MVQTVKKRTMEYGTFVSTITNRVKDVMGEGYHVQVYKVIKNNSLELDSLIVQKEGRKFAPNIYLMPYYESFLEGTPLQEIVRRLCIIYRDAVNPIQEKDFNFTLDNMKQYITYRLVSYEKNEKQLNTIPHIKYLDLAVTFHCLVRNDSQGVGTMRITEEYLKQWEISLDELLLYAVTNTRKLFPPCLHNMKEIIEGILLEEQTNNKFDAGSYEKVNNGLSIDSLPEQKEMYLLTNDRGINGASCILYENLLSEIADKIHSDFYILPSSIHETILVPVDRSVTKEVLLQMVSDINRTHVARDEVLSDWVYYYSREKDAIMM